MPVIEKILTHPGSAHKDEFLACCVLASVHRAPIVRREPVQADLDDPAIAVVDVGGEHDPARSNFDHHQFPTDHPPICSLSLVLQDLGVYNDAREFCDWLETAEWFDTRGPVETAKWLGIDRSTLFRLHSPIDTTLLRRFGTSAEIRPGEPLWEVMAWVGDDLRNFLQTLRARLDRIAELAEFWDIDVPGGPFRIAYLPRRDDLPEDLSTGLARFIESRTDEPAVVGLVYPDRRGSGFGLSRHNDHPALDFTRVAEESDVHFAHSRGFVAKTSATDPGRLRDLLKQSWIGGQG